MDKSDLLLHGVGGIKTVLGFAGFILNSLAIWIFITKKRMKSMFNRTFIYLLVANNLYLVCETLLTMYYNFGFKYVVWTLPYVAIPVKGISRTAGLLITICLSYERFVICGDPGKSDIQFWDEKNRARSPLSIFVYGNSTRTQAN